MHPEYVCSNCGAPCNSDRRMGALDVWLMCECGSEKNAHWYDDGRGGYTVYLNDAQPILLSEYLKRKK